MEDKEKLEITKGAFMRRIDTIPTWDNFKSLLNSITKQQVINFVKANLEQNASNCRDNATHSRDMAEDIDDLVEEVDAI